MPSHFPSFSHLYIEEEALDLPLTREIREAFPRAQTIVIPGYREFFNQPRQNWRAQKESMKLILAVKHGQRIHPSTEVLPQHAGAPLYYTSPVINCVYDCQYCFLQAMYRSAHMVAFVNEEDFYRDTLEAVSRLGPMTLSVSYDSDLLASEKFIPWSRRWIEFSRNRENLLIELRTKSSNFSLIQDLTPHSGVILSWSLAPESIRRRYELKTAATTARIEAAARAAEAGWRIRLCFDPVLPVGNWQEEYQHLIEGLFTKIPADSIEDVSVGVFRMGDDHLRNLKSRNPQLDLLQGPLKREGGISALSHSGELPIASAIAGQLAQKLPPSRIVVW